MSTRNALGTEIKRSRSAHIVLSVYLFYILGVCFRSVAFRAGVNARTVVTIRIDV